MGFRGWTYDQCMDTPFHAYELAMDGFAEYMEVTNPWGAAEEPEPAKTPSPAEVTAKIDRLFSRYD